MDRELLIEIGVEELPASWMPPLTRQLADRVEFRLKELRIAPGAPVESYSTPRRLTARVAKIAERQDDLDETVTGPAVTAAYTADGQPSPAALGFAKKHGIEFAQLTRAQTAKGEYLAVQKRQRGRSAVDALPDLMNAVLRDLAFPKQMHWDAQLMDGRGELLFGRPIRWLLFLYGGRVVPFTIGRAANAIGASVQEIESGAVTYGHRFLATSGRAGRSIKVRSFDEYQARLAEHFVVLEHSERRDRIARELETKARKLGGRVQTREHAALIDEVADLVEYPGVVAGFYEAGFLELPHEVLSTTLVHHQHYFPLVDDAGKLKEAFLAVVNTQPSDERLIAKNAERVVTARLRDARFFWESDRKTTLASRLERLHTVLFHKRLGSYRDKAERIDELAQWIAADALERPDSAAQASQAARLAKADLTTDMVFEFPELQGTMGGIYAREERLPEQVWKAIYYHYLPVGVEADAPPSRQQLGAAAVTWAAVSLADKLDTLAGLFKAGEKVTGSRDPFGLRRQAQGVVRILVDLPELADVRSEVELHALTQRAAARHGFAASDWQGTVQVDAFLAERLRHLFQSRGYSPLEVNAVVPPDFAGSPLRARYRLEGLKRFRTSAEFRALAILFKRAKNILDTSDSSEIHKGVTELPAFPQVAGSTDTDLKLFDAIRRLRNEIAVPVEQRRYDLAFERAAELRPHVDEFFTHVMVKADDPQLRRLRLGLLADLVGLVVNLADISEIVPQSE